MNSFYESKYKKSNSLKISSTAVNALQVLVVLISIFLITYLFVLSPNQVVGESMEPNFEKGEMVLTNKLVNWVSDTNIGKSLDFTFKRGDTIVFQKPGFDDFIRRIIALPGERVAIRDGYVYVNNKRINEEYLLPATFTKGATFIIDGSESKMVPENEYFVLGDNRNKSIDSRFEEIGFVKKEWLKGKVALIYWPFSKLGIVNTGKIEITN